MVVYQLCEYECVWCDDFVAVSAVWVLCIWSEICWRVITRVFVTSGVYGDVIRVKILFNKKENALIQMSDGTQAQLGSYELDIFTSQNTLLTNYMFSLYPFFNICTLPPPFL